MVTFYVYCHTNKINLKKYFGITSQEPIKRWKSNGSGYKNNSYFYSAIQKWGWDNFQHDILYSGLTKEEAGYIEQQLIIKFKTRDKNFGYNITAGGEGNLKYLTSEERYAALQKSRAKAREKQRADEKKHLQLKEYLKEYYKQHKNDLDFLEKSAKQAKKYMDSLKLDPEKKAAYNKRKAADKRRARQNPEIRKKTNERTAHTHSVVKQLRQQVQELNEQQPNVLSEIEKYNLMAANRCRSIKYLKALLDKFKVG